MFLLTFSKHNSLVDNFFIENYYLIFSGYIKNYKGQRHELVANLYLKLLKNFLSSGKECMEKILVKTFFYKMFLTN